MYDRSGLDLCYFQNISMISVIIYNKLGAFAKINPTGLLFT